MFSHTSVVQPLGKSHTCVIVFVSYESIKEGKVDLMVEADLI